MVEQGQPATVEEAGQALGNFRDPDAPNAACGQAGSYRRGGTLFVLITAGGEDGGGLEVATRLESQSRKGTLEASEGLALSPRPPLVRPGAVRSVQKIGTNCEQTPRCATAGVGAARRCRLRTKGNRRTRGSYG